jgi:hypothetical protein
MSREAETPEEIRREQLAWARGQARAAARAPTRAPSRDAGPDYREEIQTLATANRELKSRTDGLNDRLRWVNEQLQSMDLGVAVWLPEPVWHSEQHTQWFLGYAKANGLWQLATRTVTAGAKPRPESPAPLINAPRAVRLRAAPAVKQLLLLLTERVRSFAADVATANATLPEHTEQAP